MTNNVCYVFTRSHLTIPFNTEITHFVQGLGLFISSCKAILWAFGVAPKKVTLDESGCVTTVE